MNAPSVGWVFHLSISLCTKYASIGSKGDTYSITDTRSSGRGISKMGTSILSGPLASGHWPTDSSLSQTYQRVSVLNNLLSKCAGRMRFFLFIRHAWGKPLQEIIQYLESPSAAGIGSCGTLWKRCSELNAWWDVGYCKPRRATWVQKSTFFTKEEI